MQSNFEQAVLESLNGMSKQEAINLITKMQMAAAQKYGMAERPPKASGRQSDSSKANVETALAVVKRKDGSYREIRLQNSEGEILWRRYFYPGTIIKLKGANFQPNKSFEKNFKFVKGRTAWHWIDSLTKKEVIDSYKLTPQEYNEFKQEAKTARKKKQIMTLPKWVLEASQTRP